MKIYKYDVPNELIFRYCKIITALENKYDANLERARSEIHNEIFDHVNCCRSLYRRDDRNFNTALNKVVMDLTHES
jgi:uncharacterized protein YecT (DUF1311 family)